MTKSYIVINFIFCGIILGIFIYSAIYNPDSKKHPIQCIHEKLLGTKCPSCGMSRAFSALVRGRIDEARSLQPNSIKIFSFFMIQWFLRIVILVFLFKTHLSVRMLSRIDIIVSISLFLYTFWELIIQTFLIFHKLLIT